jgi:ribosomal protein L9
MEKAMQKYLDKAEVLIEALPYIQRFNRKIIVVKDVKEVGSYHATVKLHKEVSVEIPFEVVAEEA